jgi:hypothetical protein
VDKHTYGWHAKTFYMFLHSNRFLGSLRGIGGIGWGESFGNLRGIDGIGWCSLLERMQTGYLLLAICLWITPVEMGGIKEINSFLIKKRKGKKNPINPCF